MITSYIRNPNVRFGGASPNLFIGRTNSNVVVAWSGSTVSGITGTDRLSEIQADINTLVFSSEGVWAGSGFETQTLAAKFSRASAALEATLTSLKTSIPSGLFAVYIDNNRQGWLVGLSPASDDFFNDSFRTLNINYTTGESVENVEDGNITGIELVRVSATSKYPLAPAVTLSIINRSALFINFIV